MSNRRGTSRRSFLTRCLTGAVALGAGASLRDSAELLPLAAQSRVIVARDPLLRGMGAAAGQERVDQHRMEALLDRAMLALFGGGRAAAASAESIVAAWRKIVRPDDTVGLKVNTLGGKGISTSIELVVAVCERLQQAGVKAADIVVWDRNTEEASSEPASVSQSAATASSATALIASTTKIIFPPGAAWEVACPRSSPALPSVSTRSARA